MNFPKCTSSKMTCRGMPKFQKWNRPAITSKRRAANRVCIRTLSHLFWLIATGDSCHDALQERIVVNGVKVQVILKRHHTASTECIQYCYVLVIRISLTVKIERMW